MSKSPVQLKIVAKADTFYDRLTRLTEQTWSLIMIRNFDWLKIDWSGPLTVDWFYQLAEIDHIRVVARRFRADTRVLDDAFSRGQVSKVPREGGQP